MSLRIQVASGAVALLLTAAPVSQHAAATAQQPDTTPSLDDTRALETWLDGYVDANLQSGTVAGATVAIVRNGEVLLLRGYGLADVEQQLPVDPATTLFRIGSVSKLFTWTAVMQLRDRGLLDLDSDVNDYLDFRIPDSYPEPVTLRHLLTHTAGFEDRAYGLFGPPSGYSRGEWMERALPARVRAPGVYPAYSNYGSALAGYIVERASGMAWEDYVELNILHPIGIHFITGKQPLPEYLGRYMSVGYGHEAGRLLPKPFEWIELAPAGSISASAESMAAFMLAHLNGGHHAGARILAESTTREMHERAFAVDARLNSMALGFYEKSSHGLRIVGHNGGTQWFFTDLTLIPSEQIGIFISTNTAGDGGKLAGGLLEAFLDRYFPAQPPEIPPVAEGWNARASAYAGSYRALRRSYTTFEKFIGPMFERSVTIGEPGEILVGRPGDITRLREVEPGHFRQPDGWLEAAFVPDDAQGGRYSHLLLSSSPPTAMERVPGLQSAGLHVFLLLASLGLFASTLVLPVIRLAMQRSRKAVTLAPLQGGERWFRWAATGFAALNLAFLVIAGGAMGERAFVTAETEDVLRGALALPVLSLPLALAVVAGIVLAIRHRYWTLWGRVHYALFALAVMVFVWQLVNWNILGWQFG